MRVKAHEARSALGGAAGARSQAYSVRDCIAIRKYAVSERAANMCGPELWPSDAVRSDVGAGT